MEFHPLALTRLVENNVKDSARISVYGVDIDGNQTLILDSLTGEGEVLNLGEVEGVSSYPYLKLESTAQRFYKDTR